MWLKELKIAIVEQNTRKIESLLKNIPNELSQEELIEGQYLLKAAKLLIEDLQEETKVSMIQVKKNINFLNATQAPHISQLNIKS